MASLRFE